VRVRAAAADRGISNLVDRLLRRAQHAGEVPVMTLGGVT
jgi:hypothetical protein